MGNLKYNKIEIKSKRVLAVVDELKDQYISRVARTLQHS